MEEVTQKKQAPEWHVSLTNAEGNQGQTYETECGATGVIYYKCPSCDYTSIRKCNLILHIRQKHTDDKPFECDICGYRATQASRLKRHIKVHTGEKPFKCELCDYRSRNSTGLKVHKRYHTGETLSCDSCEYTTIWPQLLQTHIQTHRNELPFKCELCTYRTARQWSVKEHMKVHMVEKPYQCYICEYRTRQAHNLKCHMKTHTEEKRYECDICDYKAARATQIKRHKLKHNIEDVFKCKICNFLTDIPETYKLHMQSHSPDKKFKCVICSFETYLMSYLRKHMSNMHKETITKKKVKVNDKILVKGKGKTINCNMCPYETRFKICLLRHFKNVHGIVTKDTEPPKNSSETNGMNETKNDTSSDNDEGKVGSTVSPRNCSHDETDQGTLINGTATTNKSCSKIENSQVCEIVITAKLEPLSDESENEEQYVHEA